MNENNRMNKPCPWLRRPPKLCGHLADKPFAQVDAFYHTVSSASHTYKLAVHAKRYGHTICISHAAPSAIYLKQRSQTHNMLFSPERCDRVRPPAKRSEVRPCDLTVALLTPGIFDDEAEPPGNPVLSSSSESVSG